MPLERRHTAITGARADFVFKDNCVKETAWGKNMLEFKKVTLEDKDILTPFLKKYGDSSCQHSLYLMTGLSMKYGDEYAIYEGVLYIHRSLLDTENERVYLAPLGDLSENAKQKIDVLLSDAESYRKKASFFTVTESFKHLTFSLYPERFSAEDSEDYAEYMYLSENLRILPGKALAAKRNRVRAFYSEYEGSVRIEDINEDNLWEVYVFQKEWIEDRLAEGYDEMLARENEAIKFYLSHFNELEFKGIIVYVRGTVVGFAAGVALNDDCIDEVIEKGRKDVKGIYQVLCNEFALICGRDYTYINREEDLGVEGLRRAKRSYQPDHMIRKYILKEI